MSGDSRSSKPPAYRVADLAEELTPYVQRYERDRDSRAIFAYAYFLLTQHLADRLEASDPDFDEPGWVADLAVAFGDRFMAAMDAIDASRGEPTPDSNAPAELDEAVPRPWNDVHRAICLERSTVLEDLVFAMGAHISYDLPYALLAVGTEPGNLADYHRMNDVLATRTDAIQDAVTDRYNRFLTRFDRMVGGGDELFTEYWIRIGRSMAWYNAMRLQSPRSRTQAEGSINRATFHLIESARSTGPAPVRWGFALYRLLFRLSRRWPDSSTGPIE